MDMMRGDKTYGSFYSKPPFLYQSFIKRFFACCSALCGLLADAEGGTIFRFEDNTCTVAIYRGPLEAYQDGEVGLYYILDH